MLHEANINSPHIFFIEVFILLSGVYQKERNGQIFDVKVPRTYIALWKALSEGNYPALTHDEKNSSSPSCSCLYEMITLSVFFSRNDLVKTTILGKDI